MKNCTGANSPRKSKKARKRYRTMKLLEIIINIRDHFPFLKETTINKNIECELLLKEKTKKYYGTVNHRLK